jgi:hypothetical protein
MDLHRRIELYLRRTSTAPTRFGRETVNDPCFVFELRQGRAVGERVATRIHAWLDREAKR